MIAVSKQRMVQHVQPVHTELKPPHAALPGLKLFWMGPSKSFWIGPPNRIENVRNVPQQADRRTFERHRIQVRFTKTTGRKGVPLIMRPTLVAVQPPSTAQRPYRNVELRLCLMSNLDTSRSTLRPPPNDGCPAGAFAGTAPLSGVESDASSLDLRKV